MRRLVKEITLKTTVLVEVTVRIGVTVDGLQLPLRGRTSGGDEIPLDVRALEEAYHMALQLRQVLDAHDGDVDAAVAAADDEVNARMRRLLQDAYADQRPDPEIAPDDQDARALEVQARKVAP